MPTRAEIVDKLSRERARLEERYRALPTEDLIRPCTESQTPGEAPWSAKDHIAHLAMIERAFQGMIRRTLSGEKNPVGLDLKGGSSMAEIMARVHRGNQDNVEEHRHDDLDTLFADLDAARADTLALLDELTDEQLAAPLPGAPWNDGSIGGVLITNAHHAIQHWQWVEEGLAQGETT
ncbi:MAG TPA: DinB family protein [Acidimicrobiales bacterium]|nr:DinB family protein [Acidimicrobiales bacterium]